MHSGYEKNEYVLAARVSDTALRQAGFLTRIPPNVVTLIGGALVFPMILAFWAGWSAIGAFLFSISAIFDWMDGALARFQLRLSRSGQLELRTGPRSWLYLGPTDFGKKADPFFDKLRYFGALFPLGWHTLPAALILASFGFAVGLTFLRPFAKRLFDTELPSNRWGKHKVHVEILTVALLVFSISQPVLHVLAIASCVSATVLGGFSFFTQMREMFRRK